MLSFQLFLEPGGSKVFQWEDILRGFFAEVWSHKFSEKSTEQALICYGSVRVKF